MARSLDLWWLGMQSLLLEYIGTQFNDRMERCKRLEKLEFMVKQEGHDGPGSLTLAWLRTFLFLALAAILFIGAESL